MSTEAGKPVTLAQLLRLLDANVDATIEQLQAQAARIADLESRVAALEGADGKPAPTVKSKSKGKK